MLCQNFAKQHTAQPSDLVSGVIKTASPGVLQDIVDRKAYVTIGVNVLEFVLTHPDLNDADKVLWMHIYSKAAKFQNWTAQITIDLLASELGVHRRSIQRCERSLVNNGLLVREYRYFEGRQIENGLRICVPYELGQVILKTVPDRKRPSISPIARKLARRTSERIAVRTDQPRCGTNGDNLNCRDKKVTPGSDTGVTPNTNNPQQALLKQPGRPMNQQGSHLNTRGLTNISSLLSERQILIPPDESNPPGIKKAAVLAKLTQSGFTGSMGEKLFLEIEFSCSRGATWGGTPLAKRVNICLKLIRNGRWRTPKGFGH